MVQVLDKKIQIIDSEDNIEIRKAFTSLLYVPDERLKSTLIQRLMNYVCKKIKSDEYKLKIFIASQNSEFTGIVMCMIHPTYTSYGRKCGTFGWLNVKNFDSCKCLINKCEVFTKTNGLRKVRGPINFPKGIGGIGIQTSGFQHQMLYGVAFGDPKSHITQYLGRLGYKKELEYICINVTNKEWNSGNKVAKGIRLGYLSLEEIREREEEFHELIKNSFQGSIPMPDASGRYRFDEMLNTFEQVPKDTYYVREDLDLTKLTRIPEFQEALKGLDFKNICFWIHIAFERKTDKLIGAIITIPDLYEPWRGVPITRDSVDTAMVHKDYTGKGIFSGLNNYGHIIEEKVYGITYHEGTSIWNNNPDAIKAIFPHGIPVRKHYVMQKRIKSK